MNKLSKLWFIAYALTVAAVVVWVVGRIAVN